MTQYVYRFGGGVSDGGKGDKNLLGGKGANLAEMASIGLPVPPGFTISTPMCAVYYDEGGAFPESLKAEVANGNAHIEAVTGKDYRDCGRPCDTHRVALRDRVGAELPLKADAGCRNTVFNNRAQTGAEYVARLLQLGARSFRVEFLNESADDVARTLTRYGQLLRGEIGGADLWRELKLLNQLGVTRGQMETAPQIIHRKR